MNKATWEGFNRCTTTCAKRGGWLRLSRGVGAEEDCVQAPDNRPPMGGFGDRHRYETRPPDRNSKFGALLWSPVVSCMSQTDTAPSESGLSALPRLLI